MCSWRHDRPQFTTSSYARACNDAHGAGIRMPVIKVKDNEPFEVALKRFKKSVEKAGVLTELRRREHFDKPSVRRKKKAAAARKRALKKLKRMGRQQSASGGERGPHPRGHSPDGARPCRHRRLGQPLRQPQKGWAIPQ